PYDSVLGKNMADDARKVVGGKLNIKDFHKKYYSSLVGEFGDVVAEAAPEADGKDQPVKWGMVIDLQKCVGCDSCTVACKAGTRTPPGLSYIVVLEHELARLPHLAKVNLSMPCTHSHKPPCVQVCPVGGTLKLHAGIVTIDNDRCIG